VLPPICGRVFSALLPSLSRNTKNTWKRNGTRPVPRLLSRSGFKRSPRVSLSRLRA